MSRKRYPVYSFSVMGGSGDLSFIVLAFGSAKNHSAVARERALCILVVELHHQGIHHG